MERPRSKTVKTNSSKAVSESSALAGAVGQKNTPVYAASGNTRSCGRGRKGTGSNENVEKRYPVNKRKRLIENNVSTKHERRLHPKILALHVLLSQTMATSSPIGEAITLTEQPPFGNCMLNHCANTK